MFATPAFRSMTGITSSTLRARVAPAAAQHSAQKPMMFHTSGTRLMAADSASDRQAQMLEMFGLADGNQSGSIDRAAFETMFSKFSQEDQEMLCGGNKNVSAEAAFKRMDANGDGELSRDEFIAAMAVLGKQELGKLQRSVSRNELSVNAAEAQASGGLMDRILTTAEVAVSKIFPAGFGWQGASCIAGAYGYAATDPMFFIATGIGDAVGVFLGHSLWYAGKKAVYDDSINMQDQVHTAVLLGTACIFSGTGWQPAVNAFQSVGLTFTPCATLTAMTCGTLFFIGLRFSRIIYNTTLVGIEKPTYANLKADAGLSVAIGGATGCFVGTDVSFAPGDNFLAPLVGITDDIADLPGAAIAGSSTALGFTTVQMAQNVVVPAGKNWVD